MRPEVANERPDEEKISSPLGGSSRVALERSSPADWGWRRAASSEREWRAVRALGGRLVVHVVCGLGSWRLMLALLGAFSPKKVAGWKLPKGGPNLLNDQPWLENFAHIHTQVGQEGSSVCALAVATQCHGGADWGARLFVCVPRAALSCGRPGLAGGSLFFASHEASRLERAPSTPPDWRPDRASQGCVWGRRRWSYFTGGGLGGFGAPSRGHTRAPKARSWAPSRRKRRPRLWRANWQDRPAHCVVRRLSRASCSSGLLRTAHCQRLLLLWRISPLLPVFHFYLPLFLLNLRPKTTSDSLAALKATCPALWASRGN